MTANPTPKRIPELDGIRGIACMLVLCWHYFGATLPPGDGAFVQAVAWLGPVGLSGVDLFFVLSGFLIGGILHDQKASPHYYRTFYVRRVCRIFPVYYLVIGAMLLAIAVGLPDRFPAMNDWLLKDLQPLWSYATFTQNIPMAIDGQAGGKWLAMSWSVAVEEQFYLLFPFVVRSLSLNQIRSVLIAGMLASPLIRMYVTAEGWWFYTLLPCRFDCLGAGVLAALAYRSGEARALIARRPVVLPALMGASLVGLKWFTAYHLTYTWIAVFYASLLLLVVLTPGSVVARFFRARILAMVGMVSYGVYMYHQAINGVLHAVLLNQPPTLATAMDFLVTLGSTATTAAIALLSFRLVEKPLLRIGHRFGWT